jgi:KDO2-lipid IV(A) lauroyltransferase
MTRPAPSTPLLTLARALIWLLSLIPLRLLHALARPLAWLYRLRGRRKQRVVEANLALAFPDLTRESRQALARQNSIEMLRLVLETGAVWHWSERRVLAHVRSVEGRDALDRALAQGRGVLLIGAHQGNWELLTLYTSLQIDLVALYRAPSNIAMQQAITRSRQRFGGVLVASGGPAMRELLRQLRAGRSAGLLIDQQPRQGDGIFVPFFGQTALTMTLPHRLSRKTGCRIVLADCTRLPSGRGWAIRYREAPDAAYHDDESVALAAMNEALAALIRNHPAQYLWRHKRFAVQPEGQADPYAEAAS